MRSAKARGDLWKPHSPSPCGVRFALTWQEKSGMHQAYHLETMYKDVNISTGLLEEVTDIAATTPAQRTLTQTPTLTCYARAVPEAH